jgi:hypothetical protein
MLSGLDHATEVARERTIDATSLTRRSDGTHERRQLETAEYRRRQEAEEAHPLVREAPQMRRGDVGQVHGRHQVTSAASNASSAPNAIA